jgi:tetratricopeptide (TPR) repeat protein
MLTLSLMAALCANAQQPAARKPISLVMPTGPGRIVIRSGASLEWRGAHLYGDTSQYIGPGYWSDLKPTSAGAKGKIDLSQLNAVAEFIDKSSGLQISYILFPSSDSSASSQACRNCDAVLAPALPAALVGAVKETKKASQVTVSLSLATVSYLFQPGLDSKNAGEELHGFYASSSECAEIQVSARPYHPTNEAAMQAALDGFTFEPDYVANAEDYFALGTVFYSLAKSYGAAAIYYQRALDMTPADAPLNGRRIIVDQLSMSYGISGQIEQSRAVNEAAIKTDPDYPLYYYNLACADAEQGNAADAKVHLQEAFDRRGNTLPGEHLPDPTRDGSIQKLKKDKAFWAFVRSLPTG